MVNRCAGRFGFETSATMTAGLWAGSTSLTADFATVIWRIQLLGFNTIRLPFSFQAGPSRCPDCAHFCAHIYLAVYGGVLVRGASGSVLTPLAL